MHAATEGWIEYRELSSLAEFQEYLNVRYRVYTHNDWIEENPDGLELDPYDAHCRFVGAFHRVDGEERMIGGARMIMPDGVRESARHLSSIRSGARSGRIRSLPDRKTTYCTENVSDFASVVSFAKREKLLMVEFGRTVCLPEFQGMGVGMGLVHVLHGLALNLGVDLAVATAPPHLESFYTRFGCKVLENNGVGRYGDLNTELMSMVVDLRKLSGPFRMAYQASTQLRRHGSVRLCADRNCLLVHQHHLPHRTSAEISRPATTRSASPTVASVARPSVEVHDETLRDGLQSASVVTPDLETKLRLLHHMAGLGIESANLGLPGAGPRFRREAARLLKEIVAQRLKIVPTLAGRTVREDIDPILEASQEAGTAVEAGLFIGSSSIRHLCEDWSLDRLLSLTEQAVSYAVRHGLKVMFVTEDTVRARPETLERLYTVAIECGASRLCLCDTVGHATPEGVRRIIRFVREVVARTGEEVALDWHGHRDRGLALANSLVAIESGVDRVHGTALGVGERVGNTRLELLLFSLARLNSRSLDCDRLRRYLLAVSAALAVPLPTNLPHELMVEEEVSLV